MRLFFAFNDSYSIFVVTPRSIEWTNYFTLVCSFIFVQWSENWFRFNNYSMSTNNTLRHHRFIVSPYCSYLRLLTNNKKQKMIVVIPLGGTFLFIECKFLSIFFLLSKIKRELSFSSILYFCSLASNCLLMLNNSLFNWFFWIRSDEDPSRSMRLHSINSIASHHFVSPSSLSCFEWK